MENKTLTLETKECLALDLGRSYLEYHEIDDVCVKTFPDEALNAMTAFKNVMNGDVYDPGIENKGFSNHVGWLEPVKETLKPSSEEVQSVLKTAEKIHKESDVLAVVASGAAYLSCKAGLDFFSSSKASGSPEILLFGSGTDSIEKLKDRKVSLCVIEDGELSSEARKAFDAIKPMLKGKSYVFTNNNKGALTKEDAELFSMSEKFTGPAIILSSAVLLPLAVAGIDINELLESAELEPNEDMESFVPSGCAGAGATRELFIPLSSLNIKNYSAGRHLFKTKDFGLEVFVYADDRLRGFAEWLKYLYMLSSANQMLNVETANLFENKDTVLDYVNVHGKTFFETFLNMGNLASAARADADLADKVIAGNALLLDTMQKQRKSGVPIMRVEIKDATPYFYGQMISLFSRAAAIMSIWK